MKKLLVFFYVIIVILSFSTVKAYSTDTYEISIPDSYVKSENTWQLDKENEKVTIVINVDKNNNKLNFEDYNEEKLKEDQYIKELEDELIEQLIEQGDLDQDGKINYHEFVRIMTAK